jgi:putative ABC transport system permease protein
LRKALGATEQNIGCQFLIEVMAVTLVSGLLGVGLGLGVANLVSMFTGLPVIVTTNSVVLGLGAAVVVGIASGIAPAHKAARLDPVEALR